MSLMYAQMGLAVGGAYFGQKAAKHEYKLQKMQQDYQNTMTAIAAAQELNALTANEIGQRDASMRATEAINIQSMQDKAAATVSAAAAGVKGASVTSTMRGLTRSSLRAKAAQAERMRLQGKQNVQNRRSVALNKVYGKDISVLSKPSTASALLGLGASVIDIWDSHQPEGQKITDALAGIGRK